MTASEGSSRRRAFPHQRLMWQFARFLVVGLASFAVDYGIFFVLFHFFGVQYIVASTVSFGLSLVLNYFLTLKFVFDAKPGRNVAVEFAIYIGLNIIALGLNQLILFLSVDLLGLSPLVGKLIATAVVLVYNFISRKLLIERTRPTRAVSPPSQGADTLSEGGSTS